jgi:hypothetical protein
MPEMEVEQSGVVPASETVDSGIENPQDQNRAKSEDPLTTPQVGRLPARASRGYSFSLAYSVETHFRQRALEAIAFRLLFLRSAKVARVESEGSDHLTVRPDSWAICACPSEVFIR